MLKITSKKLYKIVFQKRNFCSKVVVFFESCNDIEQNFKCNKLIENVFLTQEIGQNNFEFLMIKIVIQNEKTNLKMNLFWL